MTDMEFYCPACGEWGSVQGDWTEIAPGYEFHERCLLCGTQFIISVRYEVEEDDCPKVEGV